MEAIMKEILKITQQMDMVNTSISTDTSTKANGKTTFQTVKDKQSIQMEADTMGSS